MPALVPVVKILNKIGITVKIWEKVGVKLLREKSINFSTLATSKIRLLLFLVKRINNEISPIGEKKIHHHRRKTQENYNFLAKQSPLLNPNFIRGSTVIVIPHNVELYKQYFLPECLLLIRKSCNRFSVIAFMEKTAVGIKNL